MQEKNVNKLMSCKSINEFVSMYLGMPKLERKSVLGNRVIIKKGDKLYRARKDDGSDFSSDNAWKLAPPKYTRKGRFNREKKPVLYVGTMEQILPREIGLKPGDKYYIAEYEVLDDIKVGSLLKQYSGITMLLHKIAMAVEDETKLTLSEKEALEKLNIKKDEMIELAANSLSSFYIHRCISGDLYEFTNRIFDTILEDNPEGIRYASCYAPIELSGGREVLTLNGENAGNYALTSKAVDKLKVVNVTKNVYTKDDYDKNDLSMMINIFLEQNNDKI